MSTNSTKKGLSFNRHYTKSDVSVWDMFQYEKRSATIKNIGGEIAFHMDNVEVPAHWSQVATDILSQKYFRRAGVPQPDGSLGSETSIKQVAHRLASCWQQWGSKYGYFASTEDAQVFYDELVYSLLSQSGAPNSPQWFNTGLHSVYGINGKPQGHYFVNPETQEVERSTSAYERPQPHACFILNVEDDLVNDGGIMDLWVREARIFKYGSGVGTNYSSIRGEGEKLSGGGTSSGLMSFLRIGDRAAGAIKSGGTTRRAAKMVCLDLDHPEILAFIDWKVEEEKKVAALIAAGYPSDYEGEAYRTVSGQNSNNSVRITNEFFERLKNGEPWHTKARSNGKILASIPSQELWDKIAFAAWRCADPGTQYDTTINQWHTCPEGGRINASNPCSEYMFLDNTACNLASLNLRKYYNEDTGVFDVEGFEYMVRLWTVVLEISVLMAQFPSHEVARLSYDYRTLGLGYANIGSLLMVNGIPYDSEEGRAIAAAITAIMTGTAYKTSAEMAMHLGTFAKYEENKSHFMRVMRNHRAAAYDADDAYEGLDMKPMSINAKYCPAYLLSAATKAWDDAVKWGELYGYRNAQTTVLAPTGTIGMIMDCDTTGIEPDFALVKHKKLSGGGYFKLINQSLPAALKKLGYSTQEIDAIVKYTIGVNSIDNAPFINAPTLLSKGFNANDIKKLNNACATALHISHIFSAGVLGNDCMERIGLTPAQYGNPEFNVLQFLGFITEQINAANKYVCGMMTIEGAPYLKPEHYAVFDCANKCGEHGTRFIHPHGHLYMMGATQPFISGAISKTVNLPYEATMEEMRECYFLSWKIGIKACALYRDGSKLSQPLNTANSSDNKDSKENTATASAQAPEADAATTARLIDMSALSDKELLDELNKRMQASEDTILKRKLSTIVERQQLPFKRKGYTIKAKVGGQALFLRTGEYSDGTLGEIFIDMAKEGATMRSLLNSFAIAISVGLQYGVPLEEFVEKFTFTRFEPSGPVDHPNIKYATSVLDYIFRLLAWEYLGNEDMIHVKQTPEETNPNAESAEPTKKQELGNIRVAAPQKTKQPTPQTADVAHNNAYTAKVHTDKSADAPACSQCGNITYRNGTCYICPNCGTTTGCS